MIAALLVGVVLGGMEAPEQQVREEHLDPAVMVHQVDVYGFTGRLTMVHIPGDSFEPYNINCAQCLEVAAAAASDDTQNWLIEKHAQDRYFVVRVGDIPDTKDNPSEGFTTNIVVKLDGGHVVQLNMHLLRASEAQKTGRKADGVLTLNVPAAASLAGKLGVERAKIAAEKKRDVARETLTILHERLAGEVRCRKVDRPRKPFRTDRTVVTLKHLCSSDGPVKTFWVAYDIENRSDARLFLRDASLTAESDYKPYLDELETTFGESSLDFGQTTWGLTHRSLMEGSDVPTRWRLEVEPSSSGRDSVVLNDLIF